MQSNIINHSSLGIGIGRGRGIGIGIGIVALTTCTCGHQMKPRPSRINESEEKPSVRSTIIVRVLEDGSVEASKLHGPAKEDGGLPNTNTRDWKTL